MKKFLGLFGALVLFLVATIAVLAIFPPVKWTQRAIVAATRAKTGLDLQFNGPMTLSLVPRVAVRAENVVIKRPDAGTAPPVLTARAVEVNFGYWAAFGPSHVLESVSLSDPVVVAETDKQGRNVWDAPAATTREPAAQRTRRGFSFNRVEVKGGTISYRDQGSGMTLRLERMDAALRNVSEASIGEALVKAGAAVLLEPGSGTSVEVADLDAKATSFAAPRIGNVSAAGSSIRWRDRTQPSGVEATRFGASAEALGFDGAGRITFQGATVKWQDPATKATLEAEGVDTRAGGLKGGRLDELTFKSGKLAFAHPVNGALSIGNLAGTAKSARLEGLDDVSLNGSSLAYVHPTSGRIDATAISGAAKALKVDGAEDATFKSTSAAYSSDAVGQVRASMLTAAAKSASPTRLQGFALTSDTVSMQQSKRAPGAAAFELKEVSIAAPVVAMANPVDATVGFLHNNERVAGAVKLPAPQTIGSATSLPASLSLKAGRGSLDFDGRIETGAVTTAKGRARAATPAVDGLARWLGATLPATVKGPAEFAGDVDATASRISLANGRVEHGTNVMTGTFAMDLAGPRPRLSGRIAADKLDANSYLGVEPVKPRPAATQPKPAGGGGKPQIIEPEVELGDVFKGYMRAMLDQPPKRGGTLEMPELSTDQFIPAATRAKPKPAASKWSDDKIDLSAMRALDLDVEWSVKALGLRGMEFQVPQLKTVLDDGTLSLEGRDVGSKNGKLSGRARIDARQPVPAVSATLEGADVDLYALSEAIGVTPMLDGDTTFRADIRSAGNSPKQLVEQLSGKVSTNMAQGHVLGYDLGNINLATIIRWITGNREYDPERRTAVTGLVTDLDIDKGVVKDTTIKMGGPLLGVSAEGTIGLAEQRVDLNGKARIASFFSGLPFRVFGDWSKPTVQPDLNLASVFSRAPPGEATVADIVANAEIKPDAELALLIGRVLQKAGPSGLDAGTRALLEGIQKRALGN